MRRKVQRSTPVEVQLEPLALRPGLQKITIDPRDLTAAARAVQEIRRKNKRKEEQYNAALKELDQLRKKERERQQEPDIAPLPNTRKEAEEAYREAIRENRALQQKLDNIMLRLERIPSIFRRQVV